MDSELKATIQNIVNRHLNNFYTNEGLSIPCKDREKASNKLTNELFESVNESLKVSWADKDEIEGDFAQAERALLRLEPTGENLDATEVYTILESFRDILIKKHG